MEASPLMKGETMSHPYWIPDQDMRSSCCWALSAGEIVDGDAICSKCGEHSTFEKGEVPDLLTFKGLTKLLFPDYKSKEKP